MDNPVVDQEGVEDGAVPIRQAPTRSPLATGAMISFFFWFGVMFAAPLVRGNMILFVVVGLVAFIAMIVSGLIYIGASIYPDAKAFKESGYRFSLSALFYWMTVIAVGIGVFKFLVSFLH
jgi:hypothetical protein